MSLKFFLQLLFITILFSFGSSIMIFRKNFKNQLDYEFRFPIYDYIEKILKRNISLDCVKETKRLMPKFLEKFQKQSMFMESASSLSTEQEAEKYLNTLIPKFNDAKLISANCLNGMCDKRKEYEDFIMDTTRHLIGVHYENFQNENLKRQYEFFIEKTRIMLDPHFYVQPIDGNEKMMFRNKYPEIPNSYNNQPEKYESYWKSLRKWNREEILTLCGREELYLTFLRKYDNPSKLLDTLYSMENYFEQMKSIMEEIRPFYLQLHAYIRNALYKKYPKEMVSERGPIRHHLLEQLEQQIEHPEINFHYPFPNKGYSINTHQFKNVDLSIKDFAMKCDEFYKSIGFSDLPEKFWEENPKPFRWRVNFWHCHNMMPNTAEESFWYICPNMNFKGYLEFYSDLAKLHYDDLTRNFSTSYMGESYPGYTRSIGKAVKLSVLSPQFLKNNRFLVDDEIDEETNLNRLYRMAVESMFGMSQFYVYEKFWYELMDFEITKDNCKYWILENDIRGVEPPVQRNSTNFDIPLKFFDMFITFPFDVSNMKRSTPIFDEILGFSIYKYLCNITGEYIPEDEEHPLNKCNFYGNEDAGKLLMSTLSSDPTNYWYEIFDNVFDGEVGLNASAFLEYFEPLQVWLEKENEKNEAPIGWEEQEPINKCEDENDEKN